MPAFWLKNSVLIGAGLWYQTNTVPDLHDTRTRNRRRKIFIYLLTDCFTMLGPELFSAAVRSATPL